jgi:aminoglycoside phosphotransferase family enzyme
MPAFVQAPDAARQQLEATVAALRRPASYPGEVRSVEAIETHMSWVFLTESHAYKLKKPIRTAVLDHTTIEARERACDTELRLNRRLAANVYLAVVPVVAVEAALRVEAAGTPVDWLVKMRRLPRDRMLDACIARRAVQAADVTRLAATLAEFYATAEPEPLAPSAYRVRIASDLAATGRSLAQPRYGIEPAALHAVLVGQRQWLAKHGELLDARAGAVVDAHGDLRPEHVCLEPVPVVIDCLEFSRELRLLDPLSELSFLALECRRLGAAWIGEHLLAAHAHGATVASAALIAFYQSHHALVRAAIAVWHLDDDALEHTDSWPQRAAWYLRTARELL